MSNNENNLDVCELAKELIACESITPYDAGCQAIISQQLSPLGFNIESLPFGDVSNLWAKLGDQAPLFVFAGHTDVVPTGPIDQWRFPPFKPTVHKGFLYGRGAVDMKGGLAAMITACKTFLHQHPSFSEHGSIAFLITSDEEGKAIDGTAKVIKYLRKQHEIIDYCIVGEPSSTDQAGDTLRIGRRGSLNATLTVYGKQGHTAFPELAYNAIHAITPFMLSLQTTCWNPDTTQKYTPHQPGTTLQLSNIQAGTGATNVIPGQLRLQFNFRYAPPNTAEKLKTQVNQQLTYYQKKQNKNFDYDIEWHPSAQPFNTEAGALRKACIQAIQQINHHKPVLSTGGGTSDGRFIVALAKEVLELGLCNDTIHQINERVRVDDLKSLETIYHRILTSLFYNP